MLDFVIFAITFFVVLISLVIYLYPGSRRHTTIDGLDPSDPKEGNYADIIKAESFHQFLVDLHQKFGSLASFWIFGPTLAVSVRSETLIKSIDYLTEKPKEVNQLYEPFFGKNSLLFAQKHDFRRQRALWEQMFSDDNINVQKNVIKGLIAELLDKWSSLPEQQHISVGNYMKAFTLRLSLISGFGQYFQKPNSDLIEFSRSFENCFTELEARVSGDLPSVQSIRNEKFDQSVDKCRQLLEKAIEHLRNNPSDSGLLRTFLKDSVLSNEQLIDQSMTFVFMYYSMSSALMWSLYYLSSESELQTELSEKIALNTENDLMNQFIDSSISSANVIQWTSRINPDVENQLDGHLVPKGTPIICLLSSDQFLDSSSDCPLDIFRKHFGSSGDGPSLAFGSKASKRCCPAISYSKFIIKEFITQLIKSLEIQSIDSDITHRQMYRIYSKSEDEIWITVKKRQ